MTVNCRQTNALFGIVFIMIVDFLKICVKLTFNHPVEGNWIRLSFFPCVNINAKNHDNGRRDQNTRDIIYNDIIVYSTEHQ